MRIRAIFILLLVSTAVEVQAHEPRRGLIMATLGPYLYTSHLDTHFRGHEESVLAGVSLIAEGDIDKNGGLEIAMTYMHKPYFRRSGEQILIEKVKRMHISMGYRHWFSSSFSAALGLYSSYSMGDYEAIHTDFLPADDFKTTAQSISEDGIDASLMYEFLAHKKAAGILELRYSYSLSTLSNEISDQYGMLIGFKYQVQENQRSETAP